MASQLALSSKKNSSREKEPCRETGGAFLLGCERFVEMLIMNMSEECLRFGLSCSKGISGRCCCL